MVLEPASSASQVTLCRAFLGQPQRHTFVPPAAVVSERPSDWPALASTSVYAGICSAVSVEADARSLHTSKAKGEGRLYSIHDAFPEARTKLPTTSSTLGTWSTSMCGPRTCCSAPSHRPIHLGRCAGASRGRLD
jgi:hypothetical protein